MGNDIVFGMLNDIVFGLLGVLTRNVERHRGCTSRLPRRPPSHARARFYRAALAPLLMTLHLPHDFPRRRHLSTLPAGGR